MHAVHAAALSNVNATAAIVVITHAVVKLPGDAVVPTGELPGAPGAVPGVPDPEAATYLAAAAEAATAAGSPDPANDIAK